MKTKRWGYIVLAVVIALAALWGCQAIKPEEPEARSYNTACYMAQGGALWVCDNGGTIYIGADGVLTVEGEAGFAEVVAEGLAVYGDALISDTFTVSGTAYLYGNLAVAGETLLVDDVLMAGDVVISDTLIVANGITGDLTGTVRGDVTGNLTGDVTGNVTGDVTGTLTGDITGPTTVTGDFTTTGEIVFGADQLYVLGVGLPGFQFGGGRLEITGTAVFTHATGTPWAGVCTLDTVAPDYAFCGIEMSTNSITITIYSITETAQSATPAWVNWLLLGIPSP